jgi:hypothetical protein
MKKMRANFFALWCASVLSFITTTAQASSWEMKMYEHGKISVVYWVVAIVIIGLSLKITLLNLRLKKEKRNHHS